MISSIYVITCCVNQKRYVGFTKHKPHVRWNEHRRHYMTEESKPFLSLIEVDYHINLVVSNLHRREIHHHDDEDFSYHCVGRKELYH